MDDEESFSIGVSVSSQRLSIADLGDVLALFGDQWDSVEPRELNARLRSGVPGENGVALHVHLLDEGVASASSNVLLAVQLLQSIPVKQLLAQDPGASVDVHAQHCFAEHGASSPTTLTRAALTALASLDDSYFDIDQYDRADSRVLTWLQPVIAPDYGYRYRTRATLELRGAQGESVLLVARTARAEDFQPYEAELANAVDEWKRSSTAFSIVESRCTLRQTVRFPGNQGVGMSLSSAFVRMLASLNAELTIDVRHRFAVDLTAHWRRLRHA